MKPAEYLIPKYLYQQHAKIRKECLKTFKKVPAIFSHYHCPAAQKYSLENFPTEFYGEKISGIVFEGWSLRSLIESAFNAGAIYGQSPKKWQENDQKAKELYKKTEEFVLTFGKNKYHICSMHRISIKGNKISFFLTKEGTNERKFPIKQYLNQRAKLMKKFPKNK